MTEDVSELLFNLASDDRLALLSAISKQRQRLTTLSKTISASAQECSRHLARLTDAGLVSKDSDSFYQITPLGRSILDLLPGIRFLLEHKGYFREHDLSFLPRSFLERIGELENCTYIEHFSKVLDRIKGTITSGRKYVWLISDQPIVVGNTAGVSFYSPELPVRFIFEPTVDRKILNQISTTLKRSEIALMEDIKVAMGVNEQGAGVIFPDQRGDIDFGGGFYSEDRLFCTWCSELFEFYWSKSKKVFQH